MFIFSKDGETITNTKNVKMFSIDSCTSGYDVYADEIFLGGYTIKDDAVKELHEIIRQIEAGMTSYQLR